MSELYTTVPICNSHFLHRNDQHIVTLYENNRNCTSEKMNTSVPN